MTSQTTFYVSQVIGSKIYDVNGTRLGNVMDIIVNTAQDGVLYEETFRPEIIGLKTKIDGSVQYLNFEYIQIVSKSKGFTFHCHKAEDLTSIVLENSLPLGKNNLDRQIKTVNLSNATSTLPTQFILWEKDETLDNTNFNFSQLSSKLQWFHPSCFADIYNGIDDYVNRIWHDAIGWRTKTIFIEQPISR